jgi:hypothetical protein
MMGIVKRVLTGFVVAIMMAGAAVAAYDRGPMTAAST